MNPLISNATFPDLLRAIAILVLGIVGIIAFFAGLIAAVLGKNREDSLFKISGGTFVLLVTVVANHWAVYPFGLSIGGLLIASENFMLFLAAVFNSDRKQVHRIAANWKEMSPDNINARRQLEAEQATAVSQETNDDEGGDEDSAPGDQPQSPPSPPVVTSRNISEIEQSVFAELAGRTLGTFLKQYVEVNTKDGPRQYDAIVVEDETNKIQLAVEIKYQPQININRVRRSLKQLSKRYTTSDYPTIFIFVFSDYDYNKVQQLLELKEEFNGNQNNCGVVFYELKDKGIKSINSDDLRRLMPSILDRW